MGHHDAACAPIAFRAAVVAATRKNAETDKPTSAAAASMSRRSVPVTRDPTTAVVAGFCSVGCRSVNMMLTYKHHTAGTRTFRSTTTRRGVNP